MIKDIISAELLKEFEFLSEPQKTALTEFAGASIRLATAADDYDDRSAENEGDDDKEQKTAAALVNIASGISKNVDPASKAAFIESIKEVYDDPDDELETLGESLLDAAVAYREKANAVADLFTTE